jgi:hypothetical protein
MLFIPKNRGQQKNLMKKYIIILICIAIFTYCPSWAATYFVSQSGAGSGNGSSYANRMSIANYNSGNLDASTSAGDTIYLCGTITAGIDTTEGGTPENKLIFDGDCSTQGGSDVDFQVGRTAITIDQAYTIWTWMKISGSTRQGMLIEEDYTYIRNSYFTTDYNGGGGIFVDGAENVTIGGSGSFSNLFENVGGGTHSGEEDIALRGTPADPTNSLTISYNELKGDGTSRGTDGIMCNDDEQDDVGDSGKEIVIEHNYIHDHWKENEIDLKGGGYFVIRKNIIDGPPDNYDANPCIVIMHAGVDHVWFYGNIVRNYSTTGIFVYDSNAGAQPVDDIYIWSNLIYNIDWQGITFQPSKNAGTTDVRVWNNTIVGNGANPTNSQQTGIEWQQAWVNADDFLMYNNIVAFNRDGQSSSPRRQIHTQGTSNFKIDYNQYYSNDGAAQIFYKSRDVSFSNWNDNQDANSIVADPGFTDRSNDDYTTKTNLLGAEDGPRLRSWHLDADKGLDEDSDINPQQCGNTPGGFARCAKGLSLADRDNFNNGNWGKGAFVFGSRGVARAQKNKLEVRNLRVKP